MFLFALALAAAPLQAQPAPADADARAAIVAVLTHQAAIRGPETVSEMCVEPALAAAPAAAGEEDPMQPDHAVGIRFQWHAPEAAAPVRPPVPQGLSDRERRRLISQRPPVVLPAALPAALAARLDAARIAAAAAPATGLAQIASDMVPPPMRLRGAVDCAPLMLSAPAITGDLAFVETAFACGSVCGNGNLYALERREGRWEVIGVGDVWIS